MDLYNLNRWERLRPKTCRESSLCFSSSSSCCSLLWSLCASAKIKLIKKRITNLQQVRSTKRATNQIKAKTIRKARIASAQISIKLWLSVRSWNKTQPVLKDLCMELNSLSIITVHISFYCLSTFLQALLKLSHSLCSS